VDPLQQDHSWADVFHQLVPLFWGLALTDFKGFSVPCLNLTRAAHLDYRVSALFTHGWDGTFLPPSISRGSDEILQAYEGSQEWKMLESSRQHWL
jgi:hypothetical protein